MRGKKGKHRAEIHSAVRERLADPVLGGGTVEVRPAVQSHREHPTPPVLRFPCLLPPTLFPPRGWEKLLRIGKFELLLVSASIDPQLLPGIQGKGYSKACF